MKDFHLTMDQIASLKVLHRTLCERKKVDRGKAIVLLGSAWTSQQVSEALLIDEKTVREWLEKYRHGGEEELLALFDQGKSPLFDETQQTELAKHLDENTYLTSIRSSVFGLVLIFFALVFFTPAILQAKIWSLANGRSTIEGELVEYKDGIAKLKKTDGSIVSVRKNQLSQADRNFLEDGITSDKECVTESVTQIIYGYQAIDDYLPCVDLGCSLNNDSSVLAISDLSYRIRVFDLSNKQEMSSIVSLLVPSNLGNDNGKLVGPFEKAPIRLSPDGSRLAVLPVNSLVWGEDPREEMFDYDDNGEVIFGSLRFVFKDKKRKGDPNKIFYHCQFHNHIFVYDTFKGDIVAHLNFPPLLFSRQSQKLVTKAEWEKHELAYDISQSISNPSIVWITLDANSSDIMFFSRGMGHWRRDIASHENNTFCFSSDSKSIFYGINNSYFGELDGQIGACIDIDSGEILQSFAHISPQSKPYSSAIAILYDKDQKLLIGGRTFYDDYTVFDVSNKDVQDHYNYQPLFGLDFDLNPLLNGAVHATVDSQGKLYATANTLADKYTKSSSFRYETRQLILVRDLSTGEHKYRLVFPRAGLQLTTLVLSSDAQYLAAGALHGHVFVWNMSNGELIHEFSANDPKASGTVVGFGKDSNQLTAVFLQPMNVSAKVVKWDIITGKQFDTMEIPAIPEVSPDLKTPKSDPNSEGKSEPSNIDTK